MTFSLKEMCAVLDLFLGTKYFYCYYKQYLFFNYNYF